MMDIVDFHSHILPCIDDGSASLEESLELLRQEAAQGIRHVVMTPHFYARYETPEVFLQKRQGAQERLCSAMEGIEGLPQVSAGAEVYFFRGISQSETLSQLTIQEKRCILIEMPPAPWTDSMYRELEAIWRDRGIRPIVAHIDRYISPFRTHRIPERLAELPVLVQANAEFFLNPRTRRMALRMLRADQIQLLGSDCHNLDSRPPRLGAAIRLIEKRLGQQALERIRVYQESVLSKPNCCDCSAI